MSLQVVLGAVLIALYVTFLAWYSQRGRKLTHAEIDHFLSIIENVPSPAKDIKAVITSHLPVDTSLVWGLHDNVSPLRVANFVWETYLKEKPGRNRYWIVPSADHYLQCDAPKELAAIIRHG